MRGRPIVLGRGVRGEHVIHTRRGADAVAGPNDGCAWPFPDRSLTLTASGTAAIEASIQHAGLEGGRILLPAFICRGTFEDLFGRYDIDPVFVDVDRDSLHIDVDQAQHLLDAIDAVVVDHAFGQPAPIETWRRACDAHDIVLIEDCARALGTTVRGVQVGAFGDYAIFSCAKTTPLSTGGALVHDDHGIPVRDVSIDSDGIVRALYDVLPGTDRLDSRTIAAYQRLSSMGSGEHANDGGSPHPPRGLDWLTSRRFGRYQRRDLRAEYSAMQSMHRRLTHILLRAGFDVQDRTTSWACTLQSIVPENREGILETLRERRFPVHAVWRDPWGPATGTYPVAAFLSEHVLTFRLREWDATMVDRFADSLPQRDTAATEH